MNKSIGIVALGVGVVLSSQACGSSDEKNKAPPTYDAGGESSSGAGPASAGASSGEGGSAGVTDGGGAASGAGGTAGEQGTAGDGGTASDGGTAGAGGMDREGGGEGGGPMGGAPGSAGEGGGASFDGNCDGVSLLVNCGFELPAAATGGFDLRAPGGNVGGWLVIGAGGNVGSLNSAYSDRGFSWPAQEGVQTLDLTGNTNTATGVSQAVATETGEEYELSFWLGNIVDTGGHYGLESIVSVRVNGSEIFKPTNGAGAGTKTLAWRQFVTRFTAQGTSTTIAFVNADGAADHNNIIDNVVLRPR